MKKIPFAITISLLILLLASCRPAPRPSPTPSLFPTETASPQATNTLIPPTRQAAKSPTATKPIIPATSTPSITLTQPPTPARPVISSDNLSQLQIVGEWPEGFEHGKSWSADGLQLVTASSVNSDSLSSPVKDIIRMFDTRQMKEVWSITVAQIWDLDLSPDGKTVATINDDKLELLDAATGKSISKFTTPACRQGIHIRFSPDGSYLLIAKVDYSFRTGEKDKTTLSMFTIETGECSEFQEIDGIFGGYEFSPDGQYLSALHDEKVVLWSVASKTQVAEFPEANHAVFSPSGKFLALSDQNGVSLIRLDTLDTSSTISASECGENPEVAFSPDERLLVTAGYPSRKKLRFWDVETGQLLLEYKGLKDSTSELSFSPDGRLILTNIYMDGLDSQMTVIGLNFAKEFYTSSPTPTLTPRFEVLPVLSTPAPFDTPVFPFLSVPFAYQQETPTSIATPETALQGYWLRDWSEADAEGLIRKMDQYAHDVDVPSFCEVRGDFQEAQNYIRLAAQEALLRFPDSLNRRSISWRLALSNVVLSNSESDAWILSDLENGLNNGTFDPEDFNNSLSLFGFNIVSLGFGSNNPDMLPAPNLFGDGRMAYILELKSQEVSLDGFIFALSQDAQGYYHVTPIYSGWAFIGGGGISVDDITDHTRDGLPEVIVHVDYCNCMCGQDKAMIYQWRDGRFVDLARGQISLRSDISNWEFGPTDENGIETIELNKSRYLSFNTTKRLVWDGSWYRSEDITVYPLDTKSVQNPDSSTIPRWIDMSLETGRFQEVADALRLATNSGSVRGSQEAGLSYPDYIQFELGLSYAMLSKPDQAKKVLHSLIITPNNAQTTTIPSAAKAFIKNYKDDADIYKSCLAALEVMEKAIAPFRDADGIISQENYLHQWGYAPGYSDTPLCNLRAAFRLLLSRFTPDQASDPVASLRAAGVIVAYSFRIDVNNDGTQDWVLMLATPGSHIGTDVWVLLSTRTGLQALTVEETGSYELPKPPFTYTGFRVEIISPQGSTRPIILLQAGDYLYIFQVNELHSQSYVEQLLRQDRVRQFEISGGQDVPEVKIYLNADAYAWSVDRAWITYRWERTTETFTLVDTALTAAETANAFIFNQNQAGEAIPLLQSLLAAPENPDETCYSYEDCYPRTRLLYLLGLAYELNDDKANAAHTYWQLWHDYPESPYAIMAQAKLEPIQP